MRKLLLVGAGHAHLYILKQLRKTSLPDVEVTLLNPFEYQYYSGMLSGYAEGLYDIDDIRINIDYLIEGTGVSWVKGAAVSIDPYQKIVLTDEGKRLTYDAVSFDIVSLTAGTDLSGVLDYSETIKPNVKFPDAVHQLRQSKRPVIVGGGVAGAEMALSLQTWRNQNGKDPLTLVSDGGLLEHEGSIASKKVGALARQKGIALHLHDGVEAVIRNKIVTAANRKISFADLLWLAGPRPHKLFAASSLPVDDSGYLSVEETLQVKKHPAVFGAGDCVTITAYPQMAKAGFYAVKQAPVLWDNLKGFFGKGKGRLYKPQFYYLQILSTGNRIGLILYKGKVFHGRWAWRLKHGIDRRFMKRYQ